VGSRLSMPKTNQNQGDKPNGKRPTQPNIPPEVRQWYAPHPSPLFATSPTKTQQISPSNRAAIDGFRSFFCFITCAHTPLALNHNAKIAGALP
jgi:hypothetical protein